MARSGRKSIQDIQNQYRRITDLSRDLYNRDRNEGETRDRSIDRLRLATRIGERYVSNLLNAQEKKNAGGRTHAERVADYTKKMSRSARLGATAG